MQQHGFWSKRTTQLTIMEFVEEKTSAMGNKQYAVGVTLDLKKRKEKKKRLDSWPVHVMRKIWDNLVYSSRGTNQDAV